MNRRLRKKAEKRRRKLIHRLLDLVLDINGMEPREQELTGNLPTAFFEFSGHIGVVKAKVYTDGWNPDARQYKELWLRNQNQGELMDGIRRLGSIKAETPAAGTAGESR